jgi:hypothetical protein
VVICHRECAVRYNRWYLIALLFRNPFGEFDAMMDRETGFAARNMDASMVLDLNQKGNVAMHECSLRLRLFSLSALIE